MILPSGVDGGGWWADGITSTTWRWFGPGEEEDWSHAV